MSKISELISFCTSGNVSSLQAVLDSKSLNTKQYLISRKSSNGSTCLITACKNGHKSVIEYLLNSCYADIEQKGNISIENEIIESVTPLWCAAAVGFLSVVQLLLKLGANVNHASITHSTALRAACFDGHLEVAKCLVFHGADIEQANRMGHTCLMVSCFRGHTNIVDFLLTMGARVNRKGLKGNTALHDCSEAGNIVLYKTLLDHGAFPDLKDDFGNTPIMTAALFGHENMIAELESTLCTSKQADLYELLGCYFIDKGNSIEKGIAYWYRAQHIRDNDQTCRKQEINFYPGLRTTLREIKPIINSELEPNKRMVLISPGVADLMEAVFSRVSEFSSVEDLIRLLDFPDLCNIQSLLIRIRILGPDNPDTLSYLRRYGATMLENGEAIMCINVWRLLLELQRLYIDPLSSVVSNTFLSFLEMFIHILSDRYPGVPARELKVSLIVTCLHYAVEAIDDSKPYFYQNWKRRQSWAFTKADKESTNLHYLSRLALHFIHLIETYYSPEGPHEEFDIMDDGPIITKMSMSEPIRIWYLKCVYRLIKIDPRFDQDLSIIHLCCRPDSGPLLGLKVTYQFPSYCVAKRLLDMGYNPNQTSANGVRPINLIFNLTQIEVEPLRGRLLRLLLIKGNAHLDVRGNNRSAPKTMKYFSLSDPFSQKCLQMAGLSPFHFISLKCLCAKSIVDSGMNYMKSTYLTKDMKEFVAFH